MKNSSIILAQGIRLDKEYNNILNYNIDQMLTLLRDNAHLVYEANNYSFIDEFQNIINVQVPYGACVRVNYMAFQNPRYSNKWFFCFIDKIEYNSEKSTNITFHVDSWATWWNSLSQKNCYVLREHAEDDTIGANTIDEGLDTGETISMDTTSEAIGVTNFWVAVVSNYNPATQKNYEGISIYNRNVWGSKIFLFRYDSTTMLEDLLVFILVTNADGHPEDIQNMFIVPEGLFNLADLTLTEVQRTITVINPNTYTVRFYNLPFSDNAINKTISRSKALSFSDYTPKNNKCYVYPYNYLLVSNNIGNQNIYKYELFQDNSYATFRLSLALAVGCSGILTPTYYKGLQYNYEENLPLAKFPTCAWSNDAYINWLTQNAVNNATRITGALVSTGITAYAGVQANALALAKDSSANLFQASSLSSGANLPLQVGSLIGDFKKASLLPNIEHGQNTGDVMFSLAKVDFTFCKMRCKLENWKAIDDYFSKFGYKTLRIKTPNINSRLNWNYLQIGAGESFGFGDIPQNDLDIINSIFQKGATIWHYHDNIGNYNLPNTIR